MARKKSRKLRVPLTRKKVAKKDPKRSIRNHLTRTMIISLSVSYLGHLQYGFSLIMVHHSASIRVSNLTSEEVISSKGLWLILSPTVIFFPIGGLIGIVLFANLVDRYGRKWVFLFNNILTFVASSVLLISKTIHIFNFTVFAHIIIGMSSGIFSCSDPVYLLEVSPTPVRGTMTAITSLLFSLGGLLSHILGLETILGDEVGSPLTAAVLGMLATVSIIILLFCPESPRFIFLQKKNETEAREVLRSLRTQEDVDNEMRELQEEDYYEVMAKEKKMTLWKFLHIPKFRGPIVTVLMLMAGSQLTGINAIFFYVEKVYAVMGLSKEIKGLVSLIIYISIIITIVVTINMVEVWGRRIPLILGFMICSMSCIILTFTLEFQAESDILAFISLIFITIFVIGHMLGPGSICNVALGEIFLQSTRASAVAIGYSALWFARFVSGMILVHLELILGPYSLLFYWPCSVVVFIYLFKKLPETRGKTFMEIQFTKPEEN